jgi:hypothetical protein
MTLHVVRYISIMMTRLGPQAALPDMLLALAPVHRLAAVRAAGVPEAIVRLPDVPPAVGHPVQGKLLPAEAAGEA